MNKARWLLTASLALAASAAALPSPAAACSPAIPCHELERVQPADEATEVPRNAELRVWYRKTQASPSTGASTLPVLETVDGQIVPTTWEAAQGPFEQLLIGRPETALAASTPYRLRHPFKPCSQTDAGASPFEPSCDGLCAAEVGDVISEFTTAATTKEALLAAPVLGAQLDKTVDICSNGACCGPYARCLYSVEAPALEAGQMFRVTRGGVLAAYVGSKEQLVASVGSAFNWSADFSGAGEYQVSVVDATGNRSPATTLTIPACDLGSDGGGVPPPADSGAPPPADSGAAPPADSGAPATDSGVVTEPRVDDGCALAGGRPGATTGIAVALALLLARRQRARR